MWFTHDNLNNKDVSVKSFPQILRDNISHQPVMKRGEMVVIGIVLIKKVSLKYTCMYDSCNMCGQDIRANQ